MNFQPSRKYVVSSEEMSYLLNRLGAEVVPGLSRNSLSVLSDSEQKKVVIETVEHSLVARGYLAYGDEGKLDIAPELDATLRLMIRCAYLFVMVKAVSQTMPPDLTICFVSPPVVISEILPMPFVHNLAVFLEQPDFVGDILNMIPAFAVESDVIDISVARPIWERIFNSPPESDREYIGVQAELQAVVQIANQTTFGIELSLSSLLDSTVATRNLSIRCTPDLCLLTRDSGDLVAERFVRVQTVSRDELRLALQEWLSPIQTEADVIS